MSHPTVYRILSILPLLAFAAIWTRSYWRGDSHLRIQSGELFQIWQVRGELVMERIFIQDSAMPEDRHSFNWRAEDDTVPQMGRWAGFFVLWQESVDPDHKFDRGHDWVLAIPWWFPTAASAIWPLILGRRRGKIDARRTFPVEPVTTTDRPQTRAS